MSARRMLPFLLLNVVVSATVVLAILYFWDNRRAATIPAAVSASAAVANATPPPPALAPESTDTPEPPAAEGPTVHIVKAGDTLGTISNLYSVSLDDIVAANALANPNILSIGQELIIPIGGLATATAPPPAEPTPDVSPSPIPTEALTVTQGTADVVSITAVVSPGELETEAVQIINTGAEPIALVDWKLVDQQGRIYAFAQVTLFGDGAAILVHSRAGRNGATDLYWGQGEAVWEPGETVTLLDAADEIMSTFIVPVPE